MSDAVTAAHNPFRAAGLPRVINAAGKMTALGGTAQSAPLADVLADAARFHVDMRALRALASRRIAAATGAEAGCVTSGAAAGLCIGAAALVTGMDRDLVARVPHLPQPRQIVLQAGHDISFGAPVTQMLRVGGAEPVVAGRPERVTADDVRAALGPDTVALLFVQSHHCAQHDRLSLPALLDLAHEARLPLFVDAAAEEDLRRYVAAGVDLITYSGGKALGGATVGFLAGRRALIDACELQEFGIGRAMKVGKEQIASLLTALERYAGPPDWRPRLKALQGALQHALAHREVAVLTVPDRAGRDIERVGLGAGAESLDLHALVRHLEAGDPSIRTRNHQLGEGLLLFDPREIADTDVALIAERVAAFFDAAGSDA